MKRVILHIGQSKTGTSAIQAFLTQNRGKLAEQGILYPDVYRAGMPLNMKEHNSFADSFAGYRRYPGYASDEYFEQFEKQAGEQGCNTLLLSGENFFGGLPHVWDFPDSDAYFEAYTKKLQSLKTCLGDAEITVIVYLRRQDQWLESAIAHLIRYQAFHKSIAYESDKQMLELLMPRMDYAKIIGCWQEALNPKEIIALPYKKQSLIGQSSVEDFMSRIDVPMKDFEFSDQNVTEHSSLSTEFVELKKQLNKDRRSKTRERIVISVLNDLDKKIGSGRKYQISSDLRHELEQSLQDSNSKLLKAQGFEFDKFVSEDSQEAQDAERIAFIKSEFEKKYNALPTKFLALGLEAKRVLRNKCPSGHAVLRRVFSVFRGRAVS